MKKIITTLLCIFTATLFSVSAKKPHKKQKKNKANYTHKISLSKKKERTHKTKKFVPETTLKDVKENENLWGIDISHYQQEINWAALEKEKPHFMFIKATEGVTIKDNKYSTHYAQAKKTGINVGSYHFFSYKTTGKEQASNFLSVAQHKNGDLLPVLDAEFSKVMPAKEIITSEIDDFVNSIYEQLGLYPIIYCNYKYYNTYLSANIKTKCKLWIVDYKAKPEGDWAIWQSTDRFRLTSIRGHVDLNFLNGDLTKLNELFIKTL